MYVEPNDVMAYAKAVSHLLDNPVEREAMGRMGRSERRACDWTFARKR